MDKYEFKGTPAPWYAVEYSGFTDIQSTQYYDMKDNVLDAETVGVKQMQANAHLIAAAPEMLGLLTWFNDALSVNKAMKLPKGGALHQKIQSILNKALNIKE